MKMKYLRIPAFFLAVAAVFSLFFTLGNNGDNKKDSSFVASAATYIGNCGENCTWTMDLKLGTLSIEGEGKTDDYEPKSSPWYKYRDEISEVTVSDGIKSVGDYMFAYLDRVKTVNLSKSVRNIGDGAFYACSDLLRVKVNGKSKVEKIGDKAFMFCRKLYLLPDFTKLKTIGENAFFYCYGLNEMTLGYSVSKVESGAFGGCTGLKKIKIVNFNCDIADSADTFYEKIKIVGFKASTAKKYTEKYARSFNRIKDINYLPDLKIKLDKTSVTYDGKKKKPEVKIKGLKKGRDFTVKYSHNTEPGIAKATVYASGDTLGEKTVTFKINPPKVKNITLTQRNTDSLTFSWKASKGADSYIVYIINDGKREKIGVTKATSYTAENLESGKKYSFCVRAVKGEGDNKCTSKPSAVFTEYTKPRPAKIISVTHAKGDKAKIKLEKVGKANGYEIFMAKKADGKFEKAAVIDSGKKLSVTLENIKKSKTFYFKVRSFVINGDKAIYSAFSDIKTS